MLRRKTACKRKTLRKISEGLFFYLIKQLFSLSGFFLCWFLLCNFLLYDFFLCYFLLYDFFLCYFLFDWHMNPPFD